MKVHTTVAVMLSLVTLTTGACVSRGTLDVAVADREATKAELNSAKTQSQALTEQVSELQEHRLSSQGNWRPPPWRTDGLRSGWKPNASPGNG